MNRARRLTTMTIIWEKTLETKNGRCATDSTLRDARLPIATRARRLGRTRDARRASAAPASRRVASRDDDVPDDDDRHPR